MNGRPKGQPIGWKKKSFSTAELTELFKEEVVSDVDAEQVEFR